VLAKAAGARVTGIDLAPVAGLCKWEGQVSKTWRAVIAWGGVLAQLVIFAATVVLLKLRGFPGPGFLDGLAWAFTLENGMMMFVNLIAVDPLDGFQAWKLPGLMWRKVKRPARFEEIELPRTSKAKPAALHDRELSSDEMPDEIKKTVAAMLAEAARDSRAQKR
jgi:hypothetical protein